MEHRWNNSDRGNPFFKISNQNTTYSISWCAGWLTGSLYLVDSLTWWGPLQRGDLVSSITIDWCLAPNRWGFYITHSDAPQSVGLLWTSGQLVAETSTWQHTTLPTDRHPCPPVGFEPTISAGYALDSAATGTGPLQFSTFLWVFLNWMLIMMMMIHVKHVKMLEIVLLRAMAYTNLKSVPSNTLGLQQNILWQLIHTLQTGVHNVVKNVGATSKF
jgi:hypothetical protein